MRLGPRATAHQESVLGGPAADGDASVSVDGGPAVASVDGTTAMTPAVADPDEAPLLALAEPPAKRRFAPMTIVRVVVTVGAFALIARKIGFRAVFHALGASNPWLLAAGYGVAVITILITVRQWHGLSNANGVKCSYWGASTSNSAGTCSTPPCPAPSAATSSGPPRSPTAPTNGSRPRRRWSCAGCATSPA